MTKQERQGIAEAFRACLPYLWDGTAERQENQGAVICFAMCLSGHKSSEVAQGIVISRLGGHETLSVWLGNTIGRERFRSEYTQQRMQAHRRAWVLKLIEEFES